MDADVDPFFIVISVSHFSIGTQIFCLSKYEDFIVFRPACLLKALHIFKNTILSKFNMTNITCLAVN